MKTNEGRRKISNKNSFILQESTRLSQAEKPPRNVDFDSEILYSIEGLRCL